MTSLPDSAEDLGAAEIAGVSATAGSRVRRLLTQLAGHLMLAIVAAALGLVGVFVSRTAIDVAGVPIPLGALLALAGAVALVETGHVLFRRSGVLVVAAAWLAGVGTLLVPRAAGDILVANDGYGGSFLLFGLVVLGWAAGRAMGGAGR